MRLILYLTFLALLISSCRPKEIKTELPTVKNSLDTPGVYDEIDYYFMDFKDINLNELYDNKSKSMIDSLKFGVLTENLPENIKDLNVLNNLEKLGYTKTSLASSIFKDIDRIFIEKPKEKERTTTGCTFVFKDILVFRKNNEIVGTIKISFPCEVSQTLGSKTFITRFMQINDFELLEELLKK